MMSLPSLSYIQVIRALKRAGFIVVRQRGSHIRLQKRERDKVIKLTILVHKAIKNGKPDFHSGRNLSARRNVGDEFPDLRGEVSQYRDEIFLFNWEEEIAIES